MKKSRRHALGQHFLTDQGTLRKIIDVIDPRGEDIIIEIGGGKGILTRPLAERAAEVFCIEKDSKLADHLKNLGLDKLTVIEGDVLRLSFSRLTEHTQIKVVGNIPYSISTPLLNKILLERESIIFCAFLLQKEVADRICAETGSRQYAPIGILLHNYFQKTIHFKVNPGVFSPPPRVDSGLISLRRRPEPIVSLPDDRLFLQFLRECFRHRRKMLKNNLSGIGYADTVIRSSLQNIGVLDTVRAEQLSLEQFSLLAGMLGMDKREKHSG